MGEGRIRRIDHIGVAAADLEAALRLYRDLLGLPLERVEEIPGQKLNSYHLGVGESRIEILVPTSPSSVIARHLERRGPGIHHIALEVDDLDAERRRLVEAGIEPIGEPSIGADGKRIQFFHPRSTGGVMLEICGRARPAGT